MNRQLYRGIILVLISFTQICSYGSDYYWVGGKGSWNDISHWSSTSGGIPSYTVIPGPNDNVFFDSNSFSSNSDSVFLTTAAFSNSFSYQLSYNVAFKSSGSGGKLTVEGDLVLRPGSDLNIVFYVKSNSNVNQLGISGCRLRWLVLFGNGYWELNDFAEINEFFLQQGKLVIKSDSFTFTNIYSNTQYGANKTCIQFESRFARVEHFNMDDDSILAENTVIYGLGSLNTRNAGYARFGEVHLSSITGSVGISFNSGSIRRLYCIGKTVNVSQATSLIDSIFLEQGQTINFSNYPINIGHFEGSGTCSQPIKFIGSQITGSTIQGIQSSNVSFALFRNMHFAGTLNATNSIDLVGNTGLNIQSSQTSQTYYWIGGAGQFEDPSHWSSSSGGNPASCYPKEGDTAVFDGNSFTQPDTVFYSKSIDLGGLIITTDKVYFKDPSTPVNQFNLFGNLHLGTHVFGMDSANVDFILGNDASARCSGTKLESIEIFSQSNALILLDDTIKVNSILLRNGELNIDGRVVNCISFGGNSIQNISFSMINSTINAQNFVMKILSGSLNASGSKVFASRSFYASGSIVHLPYVSLKSQESEKIAVTFLVAHVGYFSMDGNIDMTAYDGEVDTLSLEPGSLLDIYQQNDPLTINDAFIARATCMNRIRILDARFKFLSSTQLNFEYIDFEDVSMTGQNGISATNSSKVHFCSGFNVANPSSSKKYWIGGKGNWFNPIHWSNQSGGSAINCVPSCDDTAVFDHNSFSNSGDTVFLNGGMIPCIGFVDVSGLNNVFSFSGNSLTTKFGARLSSFLNPTTSLKVDQKGSGGSLIDFNGFSGRTLQLTFAGNGPHQLFGQTDSVLVIECKNGVMNVPASKMVIGYLSVGDKDVRMVTSNYPKTEVRLLANESYKIAAIGLIGIGTLHADSSRVTSQTAFQDSRVTKSITRFEQFIVEPASKELLKKPFFMVGGSIEARAVTFNRNGAIQPQLLVKCDSFRIFGADNLVMTYSSSIEVADYFFAQGNNCYKLILSGLGGSASIRSNTADFNCDHLIIDEVEAIGAANFYAGTYSQLTGTTGQWVQGANPNLATRFNGDTVSACGDSIFIDLFPYYGAADSVRLSNGITVFRSWTKDTGIIYIQAYYDLGCTIYDTLWINRKTLSPRLLGTDTFACGQDSLKIGALKNFSNPWQTKWSTGSTGDSLMISHSGNYWFEIFQPGCLYRDSIEVYLGKEFHSPMSVQDTFLCAGDSLLVNLKEASGYLVSWSDQASGHNRYLKDEGTFIYTIKDSSCESSDSFQVRLINLKVTILGDTQFCEGDSIQLSPLQSSGAFTWQDGSTKTDYWAKTNGSFMLMRRDSGCIAIDTHSAMLQSKPQLIISGDTSFCEGDSISLSVQSNVASWQWLDGQTHSPLWVKKAGSYKVQTINVLCANQDSFVVSMRSVPMYQFPDTTLCAGQNIQIPLAGFPSGLEVFMNGTNQSDMMQLEQAGSYFIRFEQDKCVGYDTIHLDYFPPIPSNMTDSIDFCSIQNRLLEVPLDTPYSYFWEGTMLTYDEVYIDTAGEYELLITDSSGCELAKSIHIYDCACKLYFPNAITINEDNKNEQFIGSGCSTVSSYRLLIYNRWGELLFESTNPMEAWDGTYKGRVCAEGVYLYLVSYNNQAQTGAPSRFHEKGTLTILR